MDISLGVEGMTLIPESKRPKDKTSVEHHNQLLTRDDALLMQEYSPCRRISAFSEEKYLS